MRFFDAHAHLFPSRRLRGLIRWVRRAFPSHPVAVDVLLDELVDEMRACGTEYIVNLMFPLASGEVDTLHDFNARLAARIPGLLPMAGVHPANPNCLEQTIHALDELGFVGVKIHTMVQQIDPFDKILHPVYTELEQRQRPLWLHTGFEYIYNIEFPDEHLRRIAEQFPKMPVVLAHAMFPRLEAAFQLAAACPNIYLDMTNVFGVLAHPAMYGPSDLQLDYGLLIDTLHWGLEEFAGRIVFGSDHPAGIGGLEQILADLASIAIAPRARQAMLMDAPHALFSEWAPGWMARK